MIAQRGLKAVGYIRVSTDEQAKDGQSLELQESRIRAYCEAKGWELLRVYRDEGVSGKDLNRPGIQSLISDLQDNGVDVVVILKLDRIARSVRALGDLLDDLFQGVALASVEESLDSSTANGRMMTNILASVAQWEREIIVERTVEALDHKAEKGEHVGRIPYGFRIGEDGKLEEDPEQFENIRKMKREHSRGKSIREIAARYGVGKSTAQRLISTDLRLLRNRVRD